MINRNGCEAAHMKTAAKIAAGVASVAVLAGLTALALPALAPIGSIAEGIHNTARTFAPLEELSAVVPTSAPIAPVASEGTDYSTWSADDLAAARAEEPHGYLINHPSRFAPGCMQNSSFENGTLRGAQTPVDMGPREFAAGEVGYDEDGKIATYTVVPGDAGAALGERFCTDYVMLLGANDKWTSGMHPGDVLRLSR